MIRPILLASVFALAAPAVAQEMVDDMAPPVTEGVAAPDAQDQTDPNLPPGEVPTGMDHSTMDHSTMTTATAAETTPEANADTDVVATTDSTASTTATTSADAGMTMPSTTETPTGTFTGMGGPADIQAEWSSFDRVGDGMLSPTEFATWLADSMGRPAAGSGDDEVALLNESADELAMVDTNNDWHVSRDELTAASPQ